MQTKLVTHTSRVALLFTVYAVIGCGGDDGDGAAAGSGDNGRAGSGASGDDPDGGEDELCLNRGKENLMCPTKQPQVGACAPKGPCCHRASNAAKEELLGPNDPLVLEYRLNSNLTANFPTTVSLDIIDQLAIDRADLEQQSTLWRFELPRKNGKEVSGMGKVVLGYGRYNCDGTYSFYSDSAAIEREDCETCSQDPTRWAPQEIPIKVDVDKTGRERFTIAFEDDRGREYTYLPYVNADTYELDWELVFQNFDLLSIDLSEDTRDCMGERIGLRGWAPGGQFEVYTPIEVNSHERITSIMRTFCQLAAYGYRTDPPSCGEEIDRCLPTPELSPDDGDFCPWVALPDSLCPVSDDEKALWNCHLGAKGNPNADPDYPADEDLHCSAQPPDDVLDPAVTDERGQCCDPLGESDDLPACNAYRLVQDFVAAAVEITDDHADELQARCP